MNIEVDMAEVRRLAEDLGAKVQQLKPEMDALLRGAADELRDKAKASAPVDTGELRDSIAVLGGGGGAGRPYRDVGSRVRQAYFQEYGTSRHPPQAWMHPNVPAIERRMFDDMVELGFPF